MRRVSGRTLWLVFVGSLLVLVAVGLAADRITTRYATSANWVSHTQEVATQLINLRADLLAAESARLAYVASADAAQLPAFDAAVRRVPQDLERVGGLTRDNPSQQRRLAEVKPLIEQRLEILQESVDLLRGGVVDRDQQRTFAQRGVGLMASVRGILDSADTEEHQLLAQREQFSERTYEWAREGLIASFFAATLIVLAAFVKLLGELRNREQAEWAVRNLSARLLRVQDEERRRIARELHDSLGQLLASVKMNLDQLARMKPGTSADYTRELIATSAELIQESVAETRTLSYLLHPPLLDEFGFGSATKWYIEGFSARSKIKVKIDIDREFGRLPDEVELALFRLLQESLTNIHRHSGSQTAEVHARKSSEKVELSIVDHGQGMSPKTLEKFQTTQAGLGVGLAGMRERVHQLGGTMRMSSDSRGTIVAVVIPLSSAETEVSSKARISVESEARPKGKAATAS